MSEVIALDAAGQPGLARYAALAETLRRRVVRGEWPPGSALPAEQALAAEHGVALGTLRRALELLVEQGLIERIHGRGTFVRSGIAGASMLRFFRFGEGPAGVPASRI
ncbi:GntR family transcriptional regulator, partial [Paracidovorax avenae]